MDIRYDRRILLMKISYIAPVVLSAANADQGMIEKAISNAIQSTVVIPLQQALLSGWIKFVSTSYILCLAVAMAGAICGFCGIKKGYKFSVASILFYLLIRMVSFYNGWY